MKSFLLLLGTALLLAASPLAAQEPDYLTPEEIQLVRDTQEPNKRIALFLKFANERLALLESSLGGTADPADLKEMLNNFIRAVDDTAEVLEVWMDRGGVDFRKTRGLLAKTGAEFLDRLAKIQKTEAGQSEDLRYDLEDALMATEDLLALAKKIPEAPIPPKQPTVAGEEGKEQPEAPAGKPTLKRRPEEKPKPK